MLRAAVAAHTPVGRKAKSFMDAGHLVPDDVMIDIIRETLATPEAAHGFIFDGFPRTVPQAEALTEMFHKMGIAEYLVIKFNVDDEEIVRRLSGRLMCPNDGKIFNGEMENVTAGGPCPACGTKLFQRDDDSAATVRARLAVYNAKTAPVLGYYEQRGVVVTVDGTEPIDAVNRQIAELVHSPKKN
jgi:adenylate kinase